jgi:hypothetical protein
MIRAFVTLVGLVCAAALLLVPRVGWDTGGDLWARVAVLGAAGLVAGVFYQLGGVRRPGVRVNLPMLVGAWLPWTVLAVAVCIDVSGTPSSLTHLAHDLPSGALARWAPSLSIIAFVDGLLLAFALVEPLVHGPAIVARQTAPADEAQSIHPIALAPQSAETTV